MTEDLSARLALYDELLRCLAALAGAQPPHVDMRRLQRTAAGPRAEPRHGKYEPFGLVPCQQLYAADHPLRRMSSPIPAVAIGIVGQTLVVAAGAASAASRAAACA